jgi:hypothetical protein
MNRHELFRLIGQEHGLCLLDNELDEIIRVCKNILTSDQTPRAEVTCSVGLNTPAVNKADELLYAIDKLGRGCSKTGYGLPIDDDREMRKLRGAIFEWFKGI